jgi:uncharacterized membrane protein YpjA
MTAVVVFVDSALRRLFGWILAVPVIFWAVMCIDFLGFSIGTVGWYGVQLLNAPWWAWPFIPDCPLAALYGMLVFYRIRSGKTPDWLTVLAALSCIKYGIWTVIFWGTKWAATGEYLPIEVGLVIVHLAMAGQGVLLLPYLKKLSISTRMAAVAWLGLSVVVDYGYGHHPALAFPITPVQAGTWAAVLTALLALLMLIVYTPYTLSAAKARPDAQS